MSTESLHRVLAATGFLLGDEPAPGVHLGDTAQRMRPGRSFVPDAVWRSPSALSVYFKAHNELPSGEVVSSWRREIWNEGFAPLLWVISPDRVDLYNGFGTPTASDDARLHLLRTFSQVESALRELDEFAGRLALETGQFWIHNQTVDRRTGVDQKLLRDLAHLEKDLVVNDLPRNAAQALIGRVIFTQYLIDRRIVDSARLKRACGHDALPDALRERSATTRLFTWLSETFNGDMFPPASATVPKTEYLGRVADFLEAVDPETGQRSFFPYQFDVIPVELISSIYEQFVHATSETASRRADDAGGGVHYTRLSLVSLVLDEVMEGLTGRETVMDLTCGSGVFLVEALRRLVAVRAEGQPPTRELIRSTLYRQIFGVDISEAAIRVAAFSLYLGALELDPDPQPPHALRFQPLIGKTLWIGDARAFRSEPDDDKANENAAVPKRFDLIVGNPPWTFKGKSGTARRRKSMTRDMPAQPRGEGLDFVIRATDFAHGNTRFGIVLSALPFFSRSRTGQAAAHHVLRQLAPVTIVNLSNLSGWLFATATMPAVVLFARHRPQDPSTVTVVQIPWAAAGARTHTFEVSTSNVLRLPLQAVEENPTKLKAAAVGRNRDIALLDSIQARCTSLGTWLKSVGSQLSVGLIRGNQSRDAKHLKGLEVLETDDIGHLKIPAELPTRFTQSKAERPREREVYRAPLIIVKETLVAQPRPIVAVSHRDLVFTNAFFGASVPSKHADSIRLLSGILSSSFAVWYFVMTASEFGLWKRRLLRDDVASLPIPDLNSVTASADGKRVLRAVDALTRSSNNDNWSRLDAAVADVYGLDASDRVVVADGLFRGSWQWREGRERSVEPADTHRDVVRYADVFLSVVNSWLAARNVRHMRAEVFDVRSTSALRVVRFVLEEGPGTSEVAVLNGTDQIADVLETLGQRLRVKLSHVLVGNRELRVHGRDEVVIIKPSARRHWLGVAALEDADTVVAESFTGAAV